MVGHLCQKSVADILQRLLNVSESIANGEDESGSSSETTDAIRQSYVHKIVQRLVDPNETDIEVHLNAVQLLTELVFIKPVYQELTSTRCLEMYLSCIKTNTNVSSK